MQTMRSAQTAGTERGTGEVRLHEKPSPRLPLHLLLLLLLLLLLRKSTRSRHDYAGVRRRSRNRVSAIRFQYLRSTG
jgi:hypothetical protein